MTTQWIRVRIEGPIATVTLNRPEKRNALTDVMLDELLDALTRVDGHPDVRVAVLRGEGSSFCAGVDLQEKLDRQGVEGAVEFEHLLAVFDRLEHLRMPTVAVLQGTSLAGGWELGLHCDVRFATPDSRFGMPLARLGLVVPYAAAARLVRIAGVAATADLLLSATIIDGSRAHQLNLVTHLVGADALDSAVADYAARIVSLAPLAVAEMKRVLAHVAPSPAPATYAALDHARRAITASADTAEGLRAFLERRTATFTGR